MALREFGKCFKLDVSEEITPYNIYTYEHVSMGAASIQSALDILNDSDKQPFLANLGKWNCVLGLGMENRMFDLIKHPSIYYKMDCEVLMDGYCIFPGLAVGAYRIRCRQLYHNSIISHFIHVETLLL